MGSRTTTSTTFFSVLNSSRRVVNVEVDVQGPRQAEDVDEEDAQYHDEQAETSGRAPVEHPVKEQYKADREKGGKNVRQEHGAVVVARFREEVFIAFVAALFHVERLAKTEAAGFEHVTFVATWTLDVEDTICF